MSNGGRSVRAGVPMSLLASAIGLLLLGVIGVAEGGDQRSFESPEAAVEALLEAVNAQDIDALLAIFGPDSRDVLTSGDPAADRKLWKRFGDRAKERTHLESGHDGVMLLDVGEDDWPFPFPLTESDGVWTFDTEAGEEELRSREIGRNELFTIQVCQQYAGVQQDYAGRMVTAGGVAAYAQRVRSTPGTHDGLYWEATVESDESPAGPLMATASAGPADGPDEEGAALYPFHGYIYRILTAQGAQAPGGEKSYVRDGKMTDGFALVAYPAEYGETGVMTFVVNQQGVVFQKDLGPDAPAITTYDPGRTWNPTE